MDKEIKKFEQRPEPEKGAMQRFNEKIGKMARLFFAIGAAATLESQQPAEAADKPKTPTQETMDVKKELRGTGLKEVHMPSAELTFSFFDEQGDLHFNPWDALVPVELKLSWTKGMEGKIFAEIDHRYGELFKDFRPKNKADYPEVAKQMEQEFRNRFADVLINLNIFKPDRDRGLTGGEEIQVTEIKVRATASPEGPQQKGPKTLKKGAIDKENISLAKGRAEEAQRLTIDELSKDGRISVESLDSALQDVSFEEVQFTDQDWKDLAGLARNYPGQQPIDKIFKMIVAYNDGKIVSAETKAELDRIIGEKREGQVEVTYKGSQKTILTLPMPILLLLLAYPRLWWKRKKKPPIERWFEIPERERAQPPKDEGGDLISEEPEKIKPPRQDKSVPGRDRIRRDELVGKSKARAYAKGMNRKIVGQQRTVGMASPVGTPRSRYQTRDKGGRPGARGSKT